MEHKKPHKEQNEEVSPQIKKVIREWIAIILSGKNTIDTQVDFEKKLSDLHWWDESLINNTKIIFLSQCSHILTKEELKQYRKTIDERNIEELKEYITNKVRKRKEFTYLETDPWFRAYTTTMLLAEKFANEFWISSSDHPKFSLLEGYLEHSKPDNIEATQRIIANQDFFEECKKQKKAKNPLTFIDITHKETAWENIIHLKMWLYILIARKDAKADRRFFSLERNNISAFELTKEWYMLFERMFDAWCKLHRNIINDNTPQATFYHIESLQDIQDLFLWKYAKVGYNYPSSNDLHHLDGFIDVTESLFHIWSNKLRGDSKLKEDQFETLIKKQWDFDRQDSWKFIFNIAPLWDEVVTRFETAIIPHLAYLRVDDKKQENPLLSREIFATYLNKEKMEWCIPVIDEEGNRFLFSWRCKSLESLVNKMLNDAKYSHIDVFNDLLGTRFELVEAKMKKRSQEEIVWSFVSSLLNKVHREETLKYYTFKWWLSYNKDKYIDGNRAIKEKNTNEKQWWESNPKTGEWYSEGKVVGKWYEIQVIPKGNNTTGAKDETIYSFKKIEHVLRRIMNTISLQDVPSLVTRVRKWLREKRYDSILKDIEQTMDRYNTINSDIVYDMCTLQLVHELAKENIQNTESIQNTLPYLFAKTVLINKENLSEEERNKFEELYKQTRSSVDNKNICTYDSLSESTIWKKIKGIIDKFDSAKYLYARLIDLHKKDEKRKTQITNRLQQGKERKNNEIEEYIDKITHDWFATQQQQLTKDIDWLFARIGWQKYHKEVWSILEKIQQWVALDRIERASNEIFWKAIHSWQQLPKSKKIIKKIQNMLTFNQATLETVWISSTDKKTHAELIEHMRKYYTLISLSKTEPSSLFRQWQGDFKNKTSSCNNTYYQHLTKTIRQSWAYDTHLKNSILYLSDFIKQQIMDNAEWFSNDDVTNSMLLHKIKPAKIAWLNKMHSAWQKNATDVST